jgi:hypothetical protein
MQKTMILSIGLVMAFAAAPCFGGAIPIVNFSFEDPVVVLAGGFTSGATGWSTTGGGVFRPTALQLASPTDGSQVAFTNGGIFSQVLSAVLTSSTAYTLKVDFEARLECCPWPGSEVDLIAGATVLAFGQIPNLPAGGIQTATIMFTALPGNPNLGQALKIQVAALNTSGQMDFDNVRLDATPVSTAPEPGTAGLLAAGILLVGIGWRYEALARLAVRRTRDRHP